MRSKVKSIDECLTQFEIEASSQTIEKAFSEVYSEIIKGANIPGFRVGKAPMDIVKKSYANAAKEEVLKRLVPEGYKKALVEHRIEPIGMPEISELVFEEGKPLTFKAKVEVRPKFKLKSYKGLNLTRAKISVNGEDVDNTLKRLQEMNAKYITPEDRPIKVGDYVVSDVECFVDGKAVHKKRKDLWLTVEKDSFIPGLAEKLVGLKKGEEVDFSAKLPDKYPDSKLAGKDAKYHIACKEIKERQLSAIDDEFAKDLGKDNLEGLKKDIAAELEQAAERKARMDTEKQLLDKLIDDNIFRVPASFVARQLDHMVEDAKRRLMEKGFGKEDLDKKNDEFKAKFKDEAERQMRLLFILDEIAGKENIDVMDEDLGNAYKSIAAQSSKTEAEVKAYYEKEDLVDSLKGKVRETKAVKLLLDNSNITEK